MRVGFFGQTGPFAPGVLRQLAGHRGDYEIVLVVEGKRRRSRLVHRMLKPRRMAMQVTDVLSDSATSMGLPCLATSEVNASKAMHVIRSYELDLIVCIGFDRLFSADLLGLATRGGINAHPSLLPRLRGPSPIFWAMKAGFPELGVTLHALDPREDHGPIYAQTKFKPPARAAGSVLYAMAGQLAGRMLLDVLPRAAAGALRGRAQEHAHATRAPRPKAEDAFFRPEEWPTERLLNFVSAAPFFRSAWTRLGDETFFVRTGLNGEVGARLPAHYVLRGTTLSVQCQDGVAHMEIQS